MKVCPLAGVNPAGVSSMPKSAVEAEAHTNDMGRLLLAVFVVALAYAALMALTLKNPLPSRRVFEPPGLNPAAWAYKGPASTWRPL